ncbi:hypothetical protein [Arthrobacter sp. ISL-65]|uniref:hypothetical protein n=1 Tax=Arthrobacter sp. ISL-65 TaxID=2819112 RepID=UPI001BE94D9A|nr:hypothetical protein [Arthrobacter sp. ISL-65]MBT2550905.1 hypothetical protein [Arthrobacter sp. ISL-65]
MMQACAAGGHSIGAARNLRGAARHAAYAAGRAGAVAHVVAHELGTTANTVMAALSEAPERMLRMSHLAAMAELGLPRHSQVVGRLEKRG